MFVTFPIFRFWNPLGPTSGASGLLFGPLASDLFPYGAFWFLLASPLAAFWLPFGSLWFPSGSLWFLWVPLWLLLDTLLYYHDTHLDSGATCSNLELSGAIWSYLELPDAIWSYLELSGVTWSYLKLSGAIWRYLELFFFSTDEM